MSHSLPPSPNRCRPLRAASRLPGASPLLLALLLLPVLAACASIGPPPPPADLPVVDVPNLEERALLLLLADRRLYEPYTVQQALAGDAQLRRELALALGWVRDPDGRRVLEGLLLDDEMEVRRAAAFGLGELEDTAAAPALLAAAAGDDRETAVLAVEALGKIEVPLAEVLAPLTPLPEAERWARLLPHLYRFPQEAVVPLATRGLEEADPDLHARAAYALAREPRPEAAPVLRRLLTDGDPRVRAWAARALGRVGTGEDVAALAPLLDGPHPGPIIQALTAAHRLITQGSAAAPAAWRPLLLGLLEDPRPGVRLTALQVAGAWLLDPELGDALVSRCLGGPPRERELALLALAEGRHPRALDLATEAAVSPEWTLRAAAAEAALRLKAPELAARLSGDEVAAVRVAALAARLELEEEAPPLLADALTDLDAAVRATALEWLVEHPILPFETLQASLILTRQDRLVEARLTAVRALVARGAAEPLERGSVVKLLESLAEDSRYLVRRQAARGLEELDRPVPPVGAVAAGRGVANYREVVQRTRRPRRVEIRTRHGSLRVRLDCPLAPMTCLSFLQLASQGFYDGLTLHRVVPDFVVQGGDPRGDGWGGPGYTLRDEIGPLRFRRGVMGMAHSGPDTAGSQFFITLAPQPHLDGAYTAFGEVVAGMEVLDRIVQGDRIESVREVP